MAANDEITTRPELIIALVGPIGTRLNDLSQNLREELGAFGYTCVDIRLSDLLVNCADWTPQKNAAEYDRVRHLQEMGNAFRRRLMDGAAIARAALAEIRTRRTKITGNPDSPASAHAYILHQLKHPHEVELLRQVYGPSFLLIAGHAPRPDRATRLANQMARKESQPGQDSRFLSKAHDLIDIDEKESDEFGQNTRDTYPKADFFANLGLTLGEHEVRRFVDLFFGHPFRTPSREEFAMYQASAASLRSSDDNRQVGAAIVTLAQDGSDDRNTDVVAVGMNEVPRGGGGFYWDKDSPDNRDQALLQWGTDRAREIKISALAELLDKIRQKDWLRTGLQDKTPSELAALLLDDIKRTQFMEIGEFSRPVHAEMAALIDSARRGVAVNGHAIYVTTFPCHNCAKHIIAAGLRKVVYLEPYPKSRAHNLHGEEIILESVDGKVQQGQVVFSAFSGIAPRQYRRLFSLSERGDKKGPPLKDWFAARPTLLPPHINQHAAKAYLAAECDELGKLQPEVYRWNEQSVCPQITKKTPVPRGGGTDDRQT
jgi:deoxycytidylate deaminase